jgi:hypothetical protein
VSVENLAGALRLAKLAFTLDPIKEAAKLFAEATIAAGFHGNVREILHNLVRVREEAAFNASRALLAAGTENISDHDMRKNYLTLLETKLEI